MAKQPTGKTIQPRVRKGGVVITPLPEAKPRQSKARTVRRRPGLTTRESIVRRAAELEGQQRARREAKQAEARSLPRSSWWTGLSREAFASVAAAELPRMRVSTEGSRGYRGCD